MGKRAIAAVAACGLLLGACQGNATSDKYDGAMVLAFSWQPAFCERASRKRECRSQKAGRFDTNHFTLHGLWPQPGSNVYCDVSERDVKTDKARRWKKLAPLGLSDMLRNRLAETMPGVMSYLHRHEWIKHGTCYSSEPETYYADSLILMDQINASALRHLFVAHIGKRLSGTVVRNAFDQAFGAGAGDRIRISCKRDGNRELITELTLGLKGTISEPLDMQSLIAQSPETNPGCPGGIVDAVGLQ